MFFPMLSTGFSDRTLLEESGVRIAPQIEPIDPLRALDSSSREQNQNLTKTSNPTYQKRMNSACETDTLDTFIKSHPSDLQDIYLKMGREEKAYDTRLIHQELSDTLLRTQLQWYRQQSSGVGTVLDIFA